MTSTVVQKIGIGAVAAATIAAGQAPKEQIDYSRADLSSHQLTVSKTNQLSESAVPTPETMSAMHGLMEIRAGKVLHQGEHGEHVRLVQAGLENWSRAHHIALPNGFRSDGDFGTLTARAMITFGQHGGACARDNQGPLFGPKALASLHPYMTNSPVLAGMPLEKEYSDLAGVMSGSRTLQYFQVREKDARGTLSEIKALNNLIREVDPSWQGRAQIDTPLMTKIGSVIGAGAVSEVNADVVNKLFAAAQRASLVHTMSYINDVLQKP